MEPTKLKQKTKTLRKPDSMTDEECGSLEVYCDENTVISCFKASWFERIMILFTGKVWLGVLSSSGTQPPVWLSGRDPWRKNKESEV
jgi:hypothetical protein